MNALTQCNHARALSALDHISPPLEREPWMILLMAAHDAGISEDEARAWSRRGENFIEAHFLKDWNSIKPGGITERTLFSIALAAGWSGRTDAKKVDIAEIVQRDVDRAKRREKEVILKSQRQAKAADLANKIWSAAQPASDDFAYLARKGVKAHGLKVGRWEKYDPLTGEVRIVTEQALLVPIRDTKKKICSLQAIFPSNDNILGRDRDYLAGGANKGHFHTIGKLLSIDGRNVIVIVEGYATGASVHEASGHAVVVAFDKGNLESVAKMIRERLPDADIIIFSDRDDDVLAKSGGTKRALEAALAVNARIVVPEWCGLDGRDANDIYVGGFTWNGETFPGKDILAACVRYATPCRSPAFMEMLHLCGIEIEDLKARRVGGEVKYLEPNFYDSTFEMGPEQGVLSRHSSPLSHDIVEEALASVSSPSCEIVDVHEMQEVSPFDWPHSNERMQPLNTIPNLRHLLNNYQFTVRYDLIRKELLVTHPGQRGTSDNMRSKVLDTVLSLCALNKLSKTDVPSFMMSIGDDNPYNPAMDFIKSKPWDGISRLNDLLLTVQTKPGFDRELLALLLRRWLISAVAAVAKSDGFWSKGVLVFQGDQSLGKTAWFRALLPLEMRDLVKVDASIDPANKDTIISAVSHWLVELGELDGTLRKADIARLKGFISQDVDQFRRPYARAEEKFARRTVFFASVNPEHFLADDTGNVRWWTVPVVGISYDHGIAMQQLWAEVYTMFQAGERWWLDRDEEKILNSSNAEHEQRDPIDELIGCKYDFANPVRRKVTATQVLLELGYDSPNKKLLNDAANTMRKNFGEPKKSGKGRFFQVPMLLPFR